MNTTRTKQMIYTAVMATLVCVATFTIKVPTLNGYTHLGDSMIFIAVLILGWQKGAMAGALGAALADFLGGYAIWIVPTFIIKGIMAIIMGLVAEKLLPDLKFGWVIGALLGGLFQILGYTLVKIPLFGSAYAITGIPIIIMQTLSGFVISFFLITVLSKSNILEKLRGLYV